MIFGIGVDICKTERFKNYFNDKKFILRYFNENEIKQFDSISIFCEYYASRFAFKEAFSKALGTGIKNFNLKDIYIKNDENGKPEFCCEKDFLIYLNKICPNAKVHVSISHEEDNAIVFVVIEK